MQRKKLLKQEKGTIFKHGANIKLALVYPNTYWVGMSNLGFQFLYRYFNSDPEIQCERFFYDKDLPVSIENGLSIQEFDAIAFTCSFGPDISNIKSFLEKNSIPLYPSQRDETHPIVFAGGMAPTINPKPFVEIMDLVVRENQIHDSIGSWSKTEKKAVFNLSSCGLTAGSISEPDLEVKPKDDKISIFEQYPVSDSIFFDKTFSQIITPNTEFANMKLIEISRGCSRFCKFCVTSYVCGKARFKSIDTIMEQIYEEPFCDYVGLVGASISDYPYIDELVDVLEEKKIKFTISSLRADSVTEKLVKGLVRSGQDTVTIAPETGSQRLRDEINKNITEDDVINAVKLAKSCGIKKIKLYFMIGLPTETDEDITAIVDLVKKVVFYLRTKVSINVFVPQPFTPYEDFKMQEKREVKQKLKFLKKQFSLIKGVVFSEVRLKSFYEQER